MQKSNKADKQVGEIELGWRGWLGALADQEYFLIPITCFDSQGFFDHNSFIDPFAHKLGFEDEFLFKMWPSSVSNCELGDSSESIWVI